VRPNADYDEQQGAAGEPRQGGNDKDEKREGPRTTLGNEVEYDREHDKEAGERTTDPVNHECEACEHCDDQESPRLFSSEHIHEPVEALAVGQALAMAQVPKALPILLAHVVNGMALTLGAVALQFVFKRPLLLQVIRGRLRG
jgi:hypothetical protein